MTWKDCNQLTHTLETVFNQILDQRMCGLPLLNHALSVQVAGFNPVNDEWVGILITPWFMNLLLMPRLDCAVNGKGALSSAGNSRYQGGSRPGYKLPEPDWDVGRSIFIERGCLGCPPR